MEVHRGFTELYLPRSVVTTGSFDGVHVGHKVILRQLVERAQSLDAASVLISFYPHPRKILYPDAAGKDLKMIHSQEEKIHFLQQTGLDHLIIVEFSLEFAQTPASVFIEQYLVRQLSVCHVIIGFNHHFGHQRTGNLKELERLGGLHGFTVEEIEEQDIQNESVSSTKIRKALLEGYIQRANAYLDHAFTLFAYAHGDQDQKGLYQLFCPEPDKLLPPEGFYAASFYSNGSRYKAVVQVIKAGAELLILFLPDIPLDLIITFPLYIDFHKGLADAAQRDLRTEMAQQRYLDEVRELIY